MATNLTGAANATFCALPHLVARGGGAVVNVSSRGAFRGEPECPAYGASKAGLNAFGQSMAQALAPHGHRRRHRRAGLRGDRHGPRRCSTVRAATRSAAQSPTGRVARPEEVAAAVLWLRRPAPGSRPARSST